MTKISGIYQIINLVNNKRYIGQSNDIYKRWNDHKYELNRNNHDNDYLQKSWNKYGETNFSFEILEECSLDQLNEKEVYYINKYHTFTNRDKGYNLQSGGNYSQPSKEVREKLSKLISGKNNPCYGKTGEKNPFYGKKHTIESRLKIGDRHYPTGKQHPSYGKSNPAKKYSLWDTTVASFHKPTWERTKSDIVKMFRYQYHSYRVPMGRFHEFVSCEIINQLVQEAIS